MALFAPTLNNLRDLYVKELQDLYNAETQLVETLPDLVEAATTPSVRAAFAHHLVQTRNHVSRLETILHLLGESCVEGTCEAVKGLTHEAENYAVAVGDPEVRDMALINAAQRVAHYEISVYRMLRSLAHRLHDYKAEILLNMTLNEENAADKKLSDLAEHEISPHAAAEERLQLV